MERYFSACGKFLRQDSEKFKMKDVGKSVMYLTRERQGLNFKGQCWEARKILREAIPSLHFLRDS